MPLPGLQPKKHRLIKSIQTSGLILPPGSTGTGSTAKGLTLLECLIAVSVMGLTIGLVLPPLLIATATRAQTRRAEQALQVAQGEVDRVRSLVAIDQHFINRIPKDIGNGQVEEFAVPTKASSQIRTSGNCTGTTYTKDTPQTETKTALLVDVDADCRADFFMQVYRTEGIFSASQDGKAANEKRPAEFSLGVRVYSILAGRSDATAVLVGPNSSLTGLDADAKPVSLGLTNGQGNQLKRPLAALYTSISWSDQDGTLCGYQQGNANGAIESCQNFDN